jgi:hypothetical protein
MMDCGRYRSALLADPHDDHPILRDHVKTCRECALYTQRIKAFEGRLERAIRVPLPTRAPGNEAPTAAPRVAASTRRRGRPRRGMLAAAAGVLLALGLAGGVWLGAPGRSLAADVVGHMAGEPAAWRRTDLAVPPGRLDRVLAASHLARKSNAGLVSYANSCLFRGHQVPHLVVQTDRGPVTVMVLTEESLRRSVRFDEQGYRGIIVPVPGHGSIAVLERGTAIGAQTLDDVLRRVAGALDWGPQGA